jgi:WD40 repeat protein
MNAPEFKLNLAVVIGINDYHNGIPPLGTARQDAAAIAEILATDYHYQVTLITDATDPPATGQYLKQWLATELPAAIKVAHPSRLLFYFAGHGIALNGDDGPQGYLIPQDAKLGQVSTYLPMQQVEAALSQLACRHCLMILDCCFAGAFRWSSTRKISPVPETLHKERYDRFIQDPAWQVITSAASDQYALDNLDLSGDRGIARYNHQHSPFAAALMDALSGAADIYPPARPGKPAGDGVITATELYLYLRDAVEIPTDERHQRQTPQIWSLRQHDKGEFIFLPPGHVLNLPPAPSLDELEDNNPYRGLKAYETKDSDLFYGRSALIEQLCDLVSDRPLTVVLGASGSGKSSLVKAGLIPRLSGSAQPPPPHRLQSNASAHDCKNWAWQVLPPIRPGESPLNRLHSAFQELRAAEMDARSPLNLETIQPLIAAWSQVHPGTKLVLAIDQLEEVITLCQQEQARQQFLDHLAHLLQAHPDVLRVVVTLRSDFEPQFRNTPLESWWQQARFLVPAMTRDELRSVIEEPAAAKVVYFESSEQRGDLVAQLIDEVAGMPGGLPLLSFSLSELYLKLARRYLEAQQTGATVERAMTWADYDELGGVTRSLTRRADEVYDQLIQADPAYENTIRQVMLRMVAVGGELARRQVPASELQYPEPEQTRVYTVLGRFAAARLLVRGTDANDVPYIEPAHDALVRGWERLLTWKAEADETLILQRRLTPAAVEWKRVQQQDTARPQGVLNKIGPLVQWFDRNLCRIETAVNRIPDQVLRMMRRSQPAPLRQRPSQFLWDSNPYLSVLERELQSDEPWLNQVEGNFVRESALQKRRTISWRWRTAIAVILGLSGLTLAALIGQRVAQINQIRASRQSAEANFRSGQSLDAFLDSLRAAQSFKQPLLRMFPPDPQLAQAVQGTLQKAVYSVPERNRFRGGLGITRSSLSPDGQLIASVGDDGIASIWTLQGQQKAGWNTQQGPSMNLVFSPDGQQLATAGADNTVRLWNLQGQPLAVLRGHTDIVKGLSFSPDGQRIATSGRDKTIRLWNLQGKTLAVFKGHQQDVWRVVFSPDGRRLASAADDDTFRLWDLQGRQLRQFKAQQGELHTIAFSPDGQRLATAGQDGRVRLWDLQGKSLAVLEGHQGRVWQVAFSPDGQQLVSAAGDGTVRLWTGTGQPLAVFRGHQGPVRHASFTPTGQQLVSSGDDGTIRLWNLQGEQASTLTGHRGSVRAIAFSPNGQQLATGGQDATIRLWNLQGQQSATLTGDLGPVQAIAYSPDGQRLASAQGKTVRLWTLPGPARVELQGHQGLVRSVAFSADGQRLASAGDDGSIRLWTLQGKPLAQWRANQQRVWSVAFSPDGQQLASAGQDGVVRLWNSQGQLVEQLPGHLGPVYSVSFSRDGRQLASSGQDGTIRLWDLQDNRKSGLFQVYDAEVNAVAFSPDGQRLVSGDSLGYVQLWDLPNRRQFAAWSAHSHSILRQVGFSPDGTLVVTAADDGTAKLWRLEAFDQLIARSGMLIGDYLNLENDLYLRDGDRQRYSR